MRFIFYLFLFYILYKVTSWLMRGARRQAGSAERDARRQEPQRQQELRHRDVEDVHFSEIKTEPREKEQP